MPALAAHHLVSHTTALQDIVTASPQFNVDAFIPKLRDYMRVTNPYK